MTPNELAAFAQRAVQMRADLAIMRAAFTSRKFIRTLSKKQARARLNELFDTIDDLVNGAVGLAEALADDAPAVENEADLAI